MSATFEQIDISELTSEQRHALFDCLLEFFATKQEPLPDHIREQVRERIADIESSGSALVSWGDAMNELRSRWK
ncbi:MAG: hypothetical protein L3J82_09820 [Planctomycetes bacterium]|nr:hypothetical protein [Planctomycetota bacterium]